MPLRHYEGSVLPGTKALWHCPTCGAENSGPVEGGCPSCKAGADAKKVEIPPLPAPGRETIPYANGDVRRGTGAGVNPEQDLRDAFAQWLEGADYQGLAPHVTAMLEEAFCAGAAWIRPVGSFRPPDAPVASASPAPKGVYSLWVDPQDPRVAKTLATALRFYSDNTLTYGDLPGQLSDSEARTLADQLDPPEKEPEL